MMTMNSPIKLFHPTTAAHFLARDALLQTSLREGASAYPITREYPLVLAPDAFAASFCAEAGGFAVAAHANLLAREFVFPAGAKIRIGLVGNVATEAGLRGKG